jgi:hypothetical protein
MCGGIRALGRAVGDLDEPIYPIPSSLKFAALGCCYYYSSRENTALLAAIFAAGSCFFKYCSQRKVPEKPQPVLPPENPIRSNRTDDAASSDEESVEENSSYKENINYKKLFDTREENESNSDSD